MTTKTVCLGSDHRGFPVKALFIEVLKEKGFQIIDVGTFNEERCDASDFAQKVVLDLKENPDHLGILICGTGQVTAMTANRYRHVRAALCVDATMTRLARQHNDANILCMGKRILPLDQVLALLDIWLDTPFSGGERHCRRVQKMG